MLLIFDTASSRKGDSTQQHKILGSKALPLGLPAASAQLLNFRSMRGRGGSSRELRPLGRCRFGELFFEGVWGRGGRPVKLRPVDCDLFGWCECPGQAAPGNGAASPVRMARAAEIALRLAEPRIRGVGGEATLLEATDSAFCAAEFDTIAHGVELSAGVEVAPSSCCLRSFSASNRCCWRARYSRGVPGHLSDDSAELPSTGSSRAHGRAGWMQGTS